MSDQCTEETYELQLSGEGVSIKKSVRPEVARAIMNLVIGGATEYTPPPSVKPADVIRTSATDSHAGRSQDRVSLREYMDNCKASRNPDKIAAIGNYLIEFEGAPDFGRDDVKSRFRAAGEPSPGNYSRDFAWAIRNGWIAEDANAPGRFYVTQKGRSAIATQFSAEVKKASPQPKGKRGKRRNEGSNIESEE